MEALSQPRPRVCKKVAQWAPRPLPALASDDQRGGEFLTPWLGQQVGRVAPCVSLLQLRPHMLAVGSKAPCQEQEGELLTLRRQMEL